jgi:hypothetical protein
LRLEGKLTNAEGEFVASGPCEISRERGEVTMWPAWEVHMLERQQGPLSLTLENGERLDISDRHLTFKIAGPSEQRISVYRLRIVDAVAVPEHLSAGYRPADTSPAEPRDAARGAAASTERTS